MQHSTIRFWIILIVAILLASASIGLVLKIAKFLLWLIFLAILTPVFYIVLRLLLPKNFTRRSDKLKRRD